MSKEFDHSDEWTVVCSGKNSFNTKIYTDPSASRKSFIPCPECGSKKGIVIYDSSKFHETNIENITDYTMEVRCLNCDTYTVYASVNS